MGFVETLHCNVSIDKTFHRNVSIDKTFHRNVSIEIEGFKIIINKNKETLHCNVCTEKRKQYAK